jgi:glycine betaine/proline transport system ATP-binding protein
MQYTATAFAMPIRRVFSPVWRLREEIDKARVVHAGVLARPVNGIEVTGEPVSEASTIQSLARLLISDRRKLIPVAGKSGELVGVMDRQEALDVLLGSGS